MSKETDRQVTIDREEEGLEKNLLLLGEFAGTAPSDDVAAFFKENLVYVRGGAYSLTKKARKFQKEYLAAVSVAKELAEVVQKANRLRQVLSVLNNVIAEKKDD